MIVGALTFRVLLASRLQCGLGGDGGLFGVGREYESFSDFQPNRFLPFVLEDSLTVKG
jgi:hypothetical protein